MWWVILSLDKTLRISSLKEIRSMTMTFLHKTQFLWVQGLVTWSAKFCLLSFNLLMMESWSLFLNTLFTLLFLFLIMQSSYLTISLSLKDGILMFKIYKLNYYSLNNLRLISKLLLWLILETLLVKLFLIKL